MEFLSINNIKKEINGKLLFESNHISIPYGGTVGILGDNGVGKTTLLNMIISKDLDYEGKIKLNGYFEYVPQLKYEADKSGGEQELEFLKTAFSKQSKILILDEPTSNLDKKNIEWLLYKIKNYNGTIVVVSHDRLLLESVVDKLLVIDNNHIDFYNFNFINYIKTKKQQANKLEAEHQEYKKNIKRLEETIREKKLKANKLLKRKKNISNSDWKVNSRMGSYDGQSKSIAKSAKALEKRIEKIDKPKEIRNKAFLKFKSIGYLSKKVNTLIRIEKGELYNNNKLLFSYPIMEIKSSDKVIIEGRNKTGKTSFVENLFLKKLKGYFSPNLSIAYFKQNLNNLDNDKTVINNVIATSLQNKKIIINLLAMMGIDFEKTKQKVSTLSGGEKVKVSLAKILASDANLLILDEPTNYLDLTAIIALETFINQYEGAIILISHDSNLINHITNKKSFEIKNHKLLTL